MNATANPTAPKIAADVPLNVKRVLGTYPGNSCPTETAINARSSGYARRRSTWRNHVRRRSRRRSTSRDYVLTLTSGESRYRWEEMLKSLGGGEPHEETILFNPVTDGFLSLKVWLLRRHGRPSSPKCPCIAWTSTKCRLREERPALSNNGCAVRYATDGTALRA
jgi:hypothetical protein